MNVSETPEMHRDALGVEPTRTVAAADAVEVGEIVARAAAAGEAVIPWGGGTGQAYGYLPRRADVVLHLAGMSRILAVEPGDLTITVEAGATLADIQDALAPHGQFLPLDPPDADRATIGGILATDAFGPSRPFYGTARDYLIGLTVVDAQGRLVKGGGKVVKNVTGYDTPKLHIGALGTLGVIVEATFKVAPRPETARAALFALPTGIDGEASATDAIGAAFLSRVVAETAPTQRLLRDMAGARVLALLYSGMREVVDSEHAVAGRLAAEYGVASIATVPHGIDRPFTGTSAPTDALVVRIAGLPATEFARHAALTGRYGSILHRLDTYPGSGQAEIALALGEADPLAVAQDLVAWAKAASEPVGVAFLQAPVELRVESAGVALWSPLPPALRLMGRLKEMLDPAGTLNPGRFVGGI